MTVDGSPPASGPSIEPRHGPAERLLQRAFYRVGAFTSTHPCQVIGVALVVVGALTLGTLTLDFVTSPTKLWVPSTDLLVKQQDYFDGQFSPFYRVEQIIISRHDKGNIINKDMFEILFYVVNELSTRLSFNVSSGDYTVNLAQLCYSPLPQKGCMVINPLNWVQRNLTTFESVLKGTYNITGYTGSTLTEFVYYCIDHSQTVSQCYSELGLPTFSSTVFGKLDLNSTSKQATAEAAFLEVLLYNYNTPDFNGVPHPNFQEITERWEKDVFIAVLEELNSGNSPFPGFPSTYRMSYNAQRSVEDALSNESSGDIITVALSYTIMFLYIGFSLGRIDRVQSRFLLGMSGIFVVILSVISSTGILALCGVKATLIISEVIPFLILAIGVDNMFIINNEVYREVLRARELHPDRTLSPAETSEIVARSLQHVGSSVVLAACSESLAFFLGVLARMPAVTAFCIYSGLAVLVNMILQVTVFVACLSLDVQRSERRRYDCLPCLRHKKAMPGEHKEHKTNAVQSGIRKTMKAYVAPFLVRKRAVRYIIIAVFIAATSYNLYYTQQNLGVGLDQSGVVPVGSFLYNYFQDLTEFLATGPPVYYVIADVNFTAPETKEMLYALQGVMQQTPYMDPGMSAHWWLDDFLQSLCLGKVLPEQPSKCYDPHRYNITVDCNKYMLPRDMVDPDWFFVWLDDFVNKDACCDINGQMTAICGFQYRDDIKFTRNSTGHATGISSVRIRGQASTLITQSDYINSLLSAQNATTALPFWAASQPNGLTKAFPYSLYYVYFAQYSYIAQVTGLALIVCLSAVGLTGALVLWDPLGVSVVLFCIVSIIINLFFIMSIWGVLLNAISLVNIVMCIGISVEFCVHITRDFLHQRGSVEDRMCHTLKNMGSNVISGITVTKLLGVTVLNFAESRIFQIYFFRMYLAIVGLGFLHGLLLLPALLLVLESVRARRRTGAEHDPLMKHVNTGN